MTTNSPALPASPPRSPGLPRSRALPRSASVVVIGGGVIGCSVLYHLAKLGVTDAVLLERARLTAGTTWHSAGLVTPLRGSWGMTRMARHSAELYASLEAETGQATGWRTVGHLNVAPTPERLDNLHHTQTVGRAFGVPTEMLTPGQVAERWPPARTDDLLAALYTPSSGRVNPADVTVALAKGARAGGATILEGVAVEGFEIVDGAVGGVKTSAGDIVCDAVVNCTGLWARELSAMAGVHAPLYACEHFYVITEPIEGVTPTLPVMRDGDIYAYLREEVGGLLVGCFEPNPRPLPMHRLPADAAFVRLDDDWDHLAPVLEKVAQRVPILNDVGLRMQMNGPESFTLDNNPLLGEAPEVEGFWLACGMNSAGMILGGGVGWCLAEWIVNGIPPVDLNAADVRRFDPSFDNTRALEARIPEVLARHLEIPFPGHEYTSVRATRITPLHGRLKAAGAWFSQRAGWERPAWVAPGGVDPTPELSYHRTNWFLWWKAEHEAARTAVAIFDQSPFGKIEVRGPDAAVVLQELCANNVDVEPGTVVYTALLNDHGGFESDLTVTRIAEDEYFVVTGSSQRFRDLHWIRRHIPGSARAAAVDVTTCWVTLTVAGPNSRDLLATVTPADLSAEAFPYGAARSIDLGWIRARALRLSYPGELGWELHIPSESGCAVFDELVANGGPHGLRLAGAYAYGSLRIEKGFRSWGHDIGPLDTPREAGLMFAVDFDCGNFIGREALLAARERPLQRRLVNLTFGDADINPHGTLPILHGDNVIGYTTSATFGHTLGTGVAIGVVQAGERFDEIVHDARLTVEVAGIRHPATTHSRAPYDPTGQKMRC